MGRSSEVPRWTYVSEETDHRHFEELRTEALSRAIDVSGVGATAEHVVEMAERFFEFLVGKTVCKTCRRAV